MRKFLFIAILAFVISACSTSKSSIEGKWEVKKVSTKEDKKPTSGEATAALLFLNYQLEGSSFEFRPDRTFSIMSKEDSILREGSYENSEKNVIRLTSKNEQVSYSIEVKNKAEILLTDSSKMVLEMHRK